MTTRAEFAQLVERAAGPTPRILSAHTRQVEAKAALLAAWDELAKQRDDLDDEVTKRSEIRDRLIAERDTLAADRERLDWLEKHTGERDYSIAGSGDNLRAAIDAARAAP
jgi:hypothetical protein